MSTDNSSEESGYILKIFIAEIPSGTSLKTCLSKSVSTSAISKPESVIARELTARALESYLGHKPSPEELACETRTPEGKPYFQDFPDFHYNISHSGRYVVCGVICGGKDPQPIGIDIQEIPTNPEKVLKIADHFFSDEEKESLHKLVRGGDSSSALLLFCRYWTARESYMKLTGKGLAEPFSQYRPDLEHKRIITSDLENEVYLTECRAPDGYCLSVSSYIPLEPAAVQVINICIN